MKKYLPVIAVISVIAVALFIMPSLTRDKTSPDETAQNSSSEKKEITITSDICNEVDIKFISSALNKPILKTEAQHSTTTDVCQYYTDERNFVTLRVNSLSVADQKKGQELLERTTSTNANIAMDNYVFTQKDGNINDIILILNPNRFIAIDRSSTKASTNDELIALASAVANKLQNREESTVPPTSLPEKTVPLPQEEDIVRSFFEIIGEHRPSDAVSMMTPDIVNDDPVKQAWAVQFNAFENLRVLSVEPSMPEGWTDTVHVYKVNLDVKMKPEAANAVIPNYGYDNGSNIRWIDLKKIDGLWKIAGIATGP